MVYLYHFNEDYHLHVRISARVYLNVGVIFLFCHCSRLKTSLHLYCCK